MAKTIITAAEVQQAAAAGQLTVPGDAIITPLARDVARDLGVSIVPGGTSAPARPAEVGGASDGLEARVRMIVASLLGPGGGGVAAPTGAARRQAIHADVRNARLAPFPYPGPPADMSVNTVDVVTADDGSPVAAGYMSITKGSFPWTLTYDEVQIVLEGELHLGGDAGGKIGRPGDVLYVPKGSSITFGTPSWAKFVYVTFPANWEEQIK